MIRKATYYSPLILEDDAIRRCGILCISSFDLANDILNMETYEQPSTSFTWQVDE